MDRRKRKSRQAILQACIALAKEKEFQHVSVQEIVERADLNRGTFYLHFVDKVAMMNSFEEEMLSTIKQVLVKNIPTEFSFETFLQSRYDTIIQILHCYEENKELLRFITEAGNSSGFQKKLGENIKEVMSTILQPKLQTVALPIPMDLVAMIFTSLSLTLAQYAYQMEEPLDVESHAQFLINIMQHGPMKTLGFLSPEQSSLNS
jgi:AcrR family transcriptional regulator